MATATRAAYGSVLKNELYKNPAIVVLDADLGCATQTCNFKAVAPERYFDMGISEGDMMTTAAGLAACGKIPFASTFAVFAAGRAFEQIRNSICYPNLNVKIAATHAGVTVGEDGGSHQAVEDIALMRSLPNMTIFCPADAREAEEAVKAAAELKGPVYIRLGRVAVDDIHKADYRFVPGKGEILREGRDAAIIATGIMTGKALEAAELLAKEGIEVRVINMHTLKPLDEELVMETAKTIGKIVTAEEHSIIGGLGAAVCQVTAVKAPARVAMVGIEDRFGQSGTPAELLEEYGLTAGHIAEAVRSLQAV